MTEGKKGVKILFKKKQKHPSNAKMFPVKHDLKTPHEIRNREKYAVNFAHTNAYKNSTIPYCQRYLNSLADTEERAGGGEEPRTGERRPG